MKDVSEKWMEEAAEVIDIGCGTECRTDRNTKVAIIARHFAAREREEWIPVSERLPEPPDRSKSATGTMVLVDIGYTVPAWFEADGQFHWLARGVITGVKHWRPLPAAPFTAAQGEKQ